MKLKRAIIGAVAGVLATLGVVAALPAHAAQLYGPYTMTVPSYISSVSSYVAANCYARGAALNEISSTVTLPNGDLKVTYTCIGS